MLKPLGLTLLVLLCAEPLLCQQSVAQSPTLTHNTWTSGAPMPTALQSTMAGVIKGQIYVVGGQNSAGFVADNQIYNVASNAWSTGTSLPVATAASASAVVKNILYIFGGYTSAGVTNAVWAYNPKTNAWTPRSPMPTSRGSEGAAVVHNIVYVIGGNGQNLRLTTVESYDPASDTWAEEAPLLVGKSEPSVGLVKASGTATIVAADGYTTSGDTGDTEGYSPSGNSWTSLQADPTPRNQACTGGLGPKLLIAGGSDNHTLLGTTELFTLSKNAWTTKASMPQATTGPASAVYKGKLYCIGGANLDTGGTEYFNNVQIYQP